MEFNYTQSDINWQLGGYKTDAGTFYILYGTVNDTWNADDTVNLTGEFSLKDYVSISKMSSYFAQSRYNATSSTEVTNQMLGLYSDDVINVIHSTTRIDILINADYSDASKTFAVTSTKTYTGTYNYALAYPTLADFILIYDSNKAHAASFSANIVPATSERESTNIVFLKTDVTADKMGTLNELGVDSFNFGLLSTTSIVDSHLSLNWKKFVDKTSPIDPDAPYDGGDKPDESPEGDFDYTGEDIPEPELPNVSVTDSGFVTLYAPTSTELKSLADFMWSDAFSLDTFKKMFNNPMDCILGLYIVPVNVPTGTAQEITVGNIVSTVSCTTCPTQYVRVDCGTFTFNRSQFTGGYLDYSPYTKVYLYLPFIGVQELNIDEFMGATMHVTYHVDILTGAMFCYVMRNESVLYTYMGQCSENVPLSSDSYSGTISSILGAAAAIGGAVSVMASGGATAPVALGALATSSTATANVVSSMKPSVQHSGSIGGGAGIMGVNYPYLIFIAPRTAYSQSQYKFTGLPDNHPRTLSGESGFTVVQAINLQITGATDAEVNEIKALLEQGVIF